MGAEATYSHHQYLGELMTAFVRALFHVPVFLSIRHVINSSLTYLNIKWYGLVVETDCWWQLFKNAFTSKQGILILSPCVSCTVPYLQEAKSC